MHGQWIGRFKGQNTPDGLLMLDLDEFSDHYAGWGSSYPDDPNHPGSTAEIKTTNKSLPINLDVTLLPVDRLTNKVMSSLPEGFPYPRTAHVSVTRREDNNLDVDVRTDINTAISAMLIQQPDGELSRRVPLKEITTWVAFRDLATSEPFRRYIYRGQSQPYRLRTSFHRTGRADIQRYQRVAVINLHRHLSAKTQHLFDLSTPDENGSFLNLAQHHGFPTPLLDWTYSPFVAAFFAYRNVTAKDTQEEERRVRLFAFDKELWTRNRHQIPAMAAFGPHFSTIEFIAIENQRHIPQQSISTVTNVSDIELYLEWIEQLDHCEYLRVIDLPASQRDIAMRELSIMGITAGSLFPGLDGSCEQMREEYFTR